MHNPKEHALARLKPLDKPMHPYSTIAEELKRDLTYRLIALAAIAVVCLYGKALNAAQETDERYFHGAMLGDLGRKLAKTGIIASADDLNIQSGRETLFSTPKVVILSQGWYYNDELDK